MFYDHCIYEFQVEFTQTVTHRDSCGDVEAVTKHPGSKATVRLIANKYCPEIAEVWVRDRFKFSEGFPEQFKILSVEKHDIQGFLHDMMRS